MKNIFKTLLLISAGTLFFACEEVEQPVADFGFYLEKDGIEAGQPQKAHVYDKIVFYTKDRNEDFSYVLYSGAEGSNPNSESTSNNDTLRSDFQSGVTLAYNNVLNAYSTSLFYKKPGEYTITLIATNHKSGEIKRSTATAVISIYDTVATLTDYSLKYTYLNTKNKPKEKIVNAGIVGDTLFAKIPYFYDRDSLIATFKSGNATVSVNGVAQVSEVTANNFSKGKVKYDLVAPNKDGVQDLYVKVIPGGDNAAVISSVAGDGIGNVVIDNTTKVISFDYVPGLSTTALPIKVASPEGSEIYYLGQKIRVYNAAAVTSVTINIANKLDLFTADSTKKSYSFVATEQVNSFVLNSFSTITKPVAYDAGSKTYSIVLDPYYYLVNGKINLTPVFTVNSLASVYYLGVDNVKVPVVSGTTVIDFASNVKLYYQTGNKLDSVNVNVTTY